MPPAAGCQAVPPPALVAAVAMPGLQWVSPLCRSDLVLVFGVGGFLGFTDSAPLKFGLGGKKKNKVKYLFLVGYFVLCPLPAGNGIRERKQ